jgi:hypothetical protein
MGSERGQVDTTVTLELIKICQPSRLPLGTPPYDSPPYFLPSYVLLPISITYYRLSGVVHSGNRRQPFATCLMYIEVF